MKLGELDTCCGNCLIIDFCNNYEDTPPCEQPRFKNVDEETFIKIAEQSKYSDIDNIYDDAAKKIGADIK